jgi:hypothetical protein
MYRLKFLLLKSANLHSFFEKEKNGKKWEKHQFIPVSALIFLVK